jgi:hypothetical protein
MGLLSERSEDDDEQRDVVLAGMEHLESGRPDELVYDLDDWSDGDRRVLRERLEALAVPHRWEGASLVVAAADEAWIERIMDQVEDDLATALDDDVEKVAYDLSGWDDPSIEMLVEGLIDEAVPHAFDGSELFVHEIDEPRVDELVAAITSSDDDDAATPASTLDVMGGLFVAADRLVHEPRDRDARQYLGDAIETAAAAAAPYGMDRVWWDGVQAQAVELATLVDGYDPDDESVVARASALRDALRPYV